MPGHINIAADRTNKVSRDDIGALVQHLIKRMLAIDTNFTPYQRHASVRDLFAGPVHGLAVTFHLRLLHVSRETVQTLVVRQQGVGSIVEEVAIPDSDQCQHHWRVLSQWCLSEMRSDERREGTAW